MKRILQTILRIFSRLILWKYQPEIIAITGSVGKTSTKEAVTTVLRERYEVRSSKGNYNNEIGVPLSIIGSRSPGKNIFGWLWVFVKAFVYLLLPLPYPEVLVLEMGADRPGDLGYLMSFVKPKVSVVTAVGPSHLEYFKGVSGIASEKETIVKSLLPSGTAVLNYDDERVRKMSEKNSGSTIFYSLENDEADLYASGLNMSEDGISLKLKHNERVVPVRVPNMIGTPPVYAVLSAAGVGIAYKINLLEIANSFEGLKASPGRMRPLPGVKNTHLIDDSYNSAPASAVAALDALASFTGKRKIAVLGNMEELGAFTEEGHREVGQKVVDLGINFLFTVGPKAKFIADQARQMGMPDERIKEFEETAEAQKPIEKFLQPGDVLLIKGSQSMRMERIVKEIMAQPWRAEELLCRQSKTWLRK